MSFNIVVLAKQVPDTRNVGKDAMTPQGTVNRAALPAIFNPEDLNALEQALRIKDKFPDTRITILTMGLPKATDILREGLFRGTDAGVLVTDRALAGADTLATSYVLSQTIRKMGKVDLVIGGRQAIDGDTAQVGPQVAQKLGIDQVTYVEEINEITDKHLVVTRRIDGGIEQVKAPLPLMLTVTGSAAARRPPKAKVGGQRAKTTVLTTMCWAGDSSPPPSPLSQRAPPICPVGSSWVCPAPSTSAASPRRGSPSV